MTHCLVSAAASPVESADAGPRGSTHPIFTVVTLLRNQAPLLETVWTSLGRQTLVEFEWLIVDDGSSDAADAAVARLAAGSPFPIRYVRQPWRGRHVAWNRAVHLARGEFCVCLDPGEICAPTALARILACWNAIPEEVRPLFSGVTVLSLDPDGFPAGPPFPPEASIESPFALAGRPRWTRRWTALRAEVAKRFLYPVIPNERYIDERILWNRIAAAYRTFCVNAALRTLAEGPPPDRERLAVENPIGARLFYMEILGLRLSPGELARGAVDYVRFSFHAGKRVRGIILDPPRTLPVLFLLPAGWLRYVYDRALRKIERAAAPEWPAWKSARAAR